MRIHTQEKPFVCKEDSCTYSCAYLGNLNKHQRLKHSSTLTSNQNNARIWTCYFCLKNCTNLITHMRHHTKEVPFKCNFCRKKYISQDSLTYHIATHTNEKPFKCSKCNKEFKTNSELKQHVVSHTKKQRYFCKFCSYGSYFNRDIKRHLLKRHSNTSE